MTEPGSTVSSVRLLAPATFQTELFVSQREVPWSSPYSVTSQEPSPFTVMLCAKASSGASEPKVFEARPIV